MGRNKEFRDPITRNNQGAFCSHVTDLLYRENVLNCFLPGLNFAL